ncbi:MAG: hypothetical protein JXR34_09480 [Bacteroidales bacterium]|nr:hypothetical protein [Bacteroidales bacterium]
MKAKTIFLFFLITALNINTLQSQTKSLLAGWDLGLNFGFYLPAGYHAGFYDGSPTNENKLNFVLGNKYYNDEIRNSLNASDTFYVTGMPEKMRYTGAFAIGIYFRRTFDNNFGFAVQFNYSKLKAGDFFQIEVDPNTILTEPDLRLFPIWGLEERVNIDLNFSRFFPRKGKIVIPFFEAGLNINSTRVLENKIEINSKQYSLVDVYLNGSNYVPGMQQTQYLVQQGGVGFGINAGGGIKLLFSDKVSVDPGVELMYQKVNLEGYDQFKLGFMAFVRLSLTGFFIANE